MIRCHRLLGLLLLLLSIFVSGDPPTAFCQHPCCPDDPELSYLLTPRSSQKFRYHVTYESFFSHSLGRRKAFFVLLPENFYRSPHARYPALFFLHGYNFNRRGLGSGAFSPERAKEVFCRVKEEEFHWLIHQDIAPIAYSLSDPKNRTYRDLERSLQERFEELLRYRGLGKGDYSPQQIARSIVSNNLKAGGRPSEPFAPFQEFLMFFPDGDNGFYTDENEGKVLFPQTTNGGNCDDFTPGEAFWYSLLPFFYMKPGALGRYESYFLEFLRELETRPPYARRAIWKRGIAGVSMGGFGAMKLALKYPALFHSVSSQSGLLDLSLLTNKWLLKMVLPEFLEVFGRLEAQKPAWHSTLDLRHIAENNPLVLLNKRSIGLSSRSIYFDYGRNEGLSWITEGNRNFERVLNEGSHALPVQPFNGNAGHNSLFWRSRAGNVLKHHSDLFRSRAQE
jgi:hypothetical protein